MNLKASCQVPGKNTALRSLRRTCSRLLGRFAGKTMRCQSFSAGSYLGHSKPIITVVVWAQPWNNNGVVLHARRACSHTNHKTIFPHALERSTGIVRSTDIVTRSIGQFHLKARTHNVSRGVKPPSTQAHAAARSSLNVLTTYTVPSSRCATCCDGFARFPRDFVARKSRISQSIQNHTDRLMLSQTLCL